MYFSLTENRQAQLQIFAHSFAKYKPYLYRHSLGVTIAVFHQNKGVQIEGKGTSRIFHISNIDRKKTKASTKQIYFERSSAFPYPNAACDIKALSGTFRWSLRTTDFQFFLRPCSSDSDIETPVFSCILL
jgi:hypothetical protein